MMSLNINLEIEEVNLILRSLGKHPFDEIAQLINKIQQQGEAQLKLQQAVAEAEANAKAEESPQAAEQPATEEVPAE